MHPESGEECINAVENLLYEKLDEMLPHMNGCKCAKCRLDIAAIALNNLPQKYVVTKAGELYIKAEGMKQQNLADIASEITKAAAIVHGNPRHAI